MRSERDSLRAVAAVLLAGALILTTACGSLGFLGSGEPKAGSSSEADSTAAPTASEPEAAVAETATPVVREPPRMEVTRVRVGTTSTEVSEAPETVVRPQPPSVSVPATLLVGLATDRAAMEVECCGDSVRLFNQDVHHDLESAAVIQPWSSNDNGVVAPTAFFVQAAALKDQVQAEALAGRLAQALGTQAKAVFDAQSDLYKVRVGPVASRSEAQRLEPRLEQLGYRDPWILREANANSKVGFEASVLVDGERRVVRFEGRHLLIERASKTVRFSDTTYRGRLLLFVNDRGLINVINEIGFEDYLRGVVPKELGPGLYPEIEALKAQAIAARTYTLKNLGEFLGEGYDICSTPRCQVYGGMSAEHPLSDRAIAETAGEVLVAGPPESTAITRSASNSGAGAVEIVDAMFSASCGGHTENVNSVFPLKSEFYLRARPCVEDGLVDVTSAGEVTGGASLRSVLASALDGAVAKGSPETQFESELLAVAKAAQLAVPNDRLRSLRAGEVTRYLGSVFDLALDRRWFQPGSAEHSAALEDPRLEPLARALADLVALSRTSSISNSLRDTLVVSLAQALGLVERQPSRFAEVNEAGLKLELLGRERLVNRAVPVFATDASGAVSVDRVRTYPGAVLDLLSLASPAGGAPVALVHRHSSSDKDPIPARTWSRFRSKQRLQELVGARYPGFRLGGLELGQRGESSRVERLTLVGADGTRESVRGLEIRWILDIPDTWFTMTSTRRNGVDGWLFRGRGRGHGVGMCQVGAFGMAVMGSKYRDILEHYYTGAQVVDSRALPARLPWAPAAVTQP